jgi:Pentapeptide repeats (9 copies)
VVDTGMLGREACAEADANGVRCNGVCLATGDRCLAHAADRDVEAELERLAGGGALDARGVPINSQLLDRLLAAVPRNDDGQPTLTAPRFKGATFHGEAQFNRVTFQGDAEFSDVIFEGDARFREATFCGLVNFGGAIFQGKAWFAGVTFLGDAWFLGATFRDWAGFGWATFHSWVGFAGATFEGAARFDGVTFEKARQFGPMLVVSNSGSITPCLRSERESRLERRLCVVGGRGSWPECKCGCAGLAWS